MKIEIGVGVRVWRRKNKREKKKNEEKNLWIKKKINKERNEK